MDWKEVAETATSMEGIKICWDEIHDCGIGSEDAARRMCDLITGSEWHLNRLDESRGALLRSAADFADAEPTKKAIERLDSRTREILLSVAGCYMVYGVLLGIGSISGVGLKAGDGQAPGILQ